MVRPAPERRARCAAWHPGARELRFSLWLARHQRRTGRPGAPWAEPLRVLRRGVGGFASTRGLERLPARPRRSSCATTACAWPRRSPGAAASPSPGPRSSASTCSTARASRCARPWCPGACVSSTTRSLRQPSSPVAPGIRRPTGWRRPVGRLPGLGLLPDQQQIVGEGHLGGQLDQRQTALGSAHDPGQDVGLLAFLLPALGLGRRGLDGSEADLDAVVARARQDFLDDDLDRAVGPVGEGAVVLDLDLPGLALRGARAEDAGGLAQVRELRALTERPGSAPRCSVNSCPGCTASSQAWPTKSAPK